MGNRVPFSPPFIPPPFLKHFGSDLTFVFSWPERPSEEPHPPTPLKKPTSASPAAQDAGPVSILKKTWTPQGSSKIKPWLELLEHLSEPRKEWWRSSPGLFASESEEEPEPSPGPMKRSRKSLDLTGVSETPSHRTGSHVSGVWPNTSSDDESDDDWERGWDNWEEGGDESPPYTPPSNEEIYAMLKELDNKEEQTA
ncbi:ORF3 [Grizzly bear anellovirus 8]|nr:ORF3 [Grizzly bear anellovirus 8]